MITNFREQNPVGQGFFHAGFLILDAHEYGAQAPEQLPVTALSYVYDCGSVPAHAAARAREISRFRQRQQGRTIDLLFLSHLHDDHVNGVPALLQDVPVDTIVMPLLDVVERLIVFASSITEGASDGGFHRELAVDPAAAVEQFSPRQVIFVRRTGENGDGGVTDDDDVPTPDGDVPSGKDERDDRLAWKILGRGRVSVGSPYGELWATSRLGGRTYTTDDINFFVFSNRLKRSWILAPYVQPGAVDEATFLSSLGKLLEIDPTELRDKLASLAFRRELVTQRVRALRAAFKAAARDLNLTTMSLFSGPWTITQLTDPMCLGGASAFTSRWGVWFDNVHPRWLAGWLGTGDADLRDDTRLRAFLNHYRHLVGRVRTLTVPHHGSDHNSRQALFENVKPGLCVTACDSYRNWRHPAASVTQAIASAGAASIVVTRSEVTRLVEAVHLPH